MAPVDASREHVPVLNVGARDVTAGETAAKPERMSMTEHGSDVEKAAALKRVGWVPAGNGDGPLGEAEWWPPAFIEVPTMTVAFEDAYRITLELYEKRCSAQSGAELG